MSVWNIESPSFLLEMSRDECTTKQMRLIVCEWNGGYAVVIEITNNKSDILNSHKEVYNRWIYDNVASLNCPEVSCEMCGIGCGEITGASAQAAIQKIFRTIIDKHEEVRNMFSQHFPHTAEQMRVLSKK